LYELFLEHKRKRTVARLLNEAGFRTRGGADFSDTTVARLIQDPTAKGKHRLNHTRSLGRGKKWESKPQSEWEYVDIDPIVPLDLWERCNAILDDRRENYKPPAKRAVHLFAGLTFCSCGQKMYVPSNMPKYVCQACRNKIPVGDLEAAYLEQLKGFFLSSKEISDNLAKADGALEQRSELLAVKRRELQKLQQEIDRVYRLYVEEKLTGDDFAGLYKPLQGHKKRLEDEIPKAEAELDYHKINRLSAEEIRSEANDLYGRWPTLTKEEQRSVIESITERITVGAGNEGFITIDLAYLPSVEEMTKEQRNFRDSSRPRA
jgi:site-specific DNA recombinase